MAERSQVDKLPDADLVAWLESGDGEARELIVEAEVPIRNVRLSKLRGESLTPRAIFAPSGDRTEVLQQLHRDLNGIVGNATNLIRAAAAVAVRANREQLLQILKHPLVRVVRANRRVKSGGVA
jgi:hypothetical protein